MLRSSAIRAGRQRVAALAVATAVAVPMAMVLHSPTAPEQSAPTDLAGLMAAVADESATAASAYATTDYFLKIDGIPGESRDKSHAGQIDIESFSWGATNSGSAAKSGAGAGKVSFSDFSFSKLGDKASPLLMQYVASGKHIPKITLFGVSAGEQRLEYMTLTLSDVLISSFQSSGSSGGGPQDSISVNFAKIQFDYKPQGADGKLGPAIHGGWDVKANKPA